MAHIDLDALQQRLAQQQPEPATSVPADPPTWSIRPAPTIVCHGGAESTPGRRFGRGTSGHTARDDDQTSGTALGCDESTGGTRQGQPGRWSFFFFFFFFFFFLEERRRADQLNEQVEALSAKVVRAERQAEAIVGRAERAEAGRDAEHVRADALRDRIDILQAQIAGLETAAKEAVQGRSAAEANADRLRRRGAGSVHGLARRVAGQRHSRTREGRRPPGTGRPGTAQGRVAGAMIHKALPPARIGGMDLDDGS